MDLKDFVKEALLQITTGVKDAQEEVRSQGGYVNPSVITSAAGKPEATHFGTLNSGQHVLLVDFDVAVTTIDSSEGGGGAKLAVASVFSVQASGKTGSSSESTSRIQFKVPLALPLDQESKKAFDSERRREDKAKRVRRG